MVSGTGVGRQKAEQAMGFVGIATLVSDTDNLLSLVTNNKRPVITSPVAERVTPPAAPSRQEPPPTQTSQQRSSSEAEATAESQRWIWSTVIFFTVVIGLVSPHWGVVIGILGFAFWLFEWWEVVLFLFFIATLVGLSMSSNKSSRISTRSPPTQSTSVQVQPQIQAQPVQSKPAVEQAATLSIWDCVAEDIRIEGARSVINTVNRDDVAKFNAMVEDYNRHCANYKYWPEDLKRARSFIEARRSELEAEGKKRFPPTVSAPSSDSSPASPENHAESETFVEPFVNYVFLNSEKTYSNQGNGEDAGVAYLAIGCTENKILHFRIILEDIYYIKTPAIFTYWADSMDAEEMILTHIDKQRPNLLTSNTALPDSMSHSNYLFLHNIYESKLLSVAINGAQTNRGDLGIIEYNFNLKNFLKSMEQIKETCHR